MSQLKPFCGLILFIGFAITLVDVFVDISVPALGAVLLWFAGVILFFDLSIAQKKVIVIIAVAALLSWLVAWNAGYQGDLVKALSINQSLIVMLIGVNFLQLIARPHCDSQEGLPTGKAAFFKTYIGTHFFGSVINLSSVMIVGQRLAIKNRLSKNQQILLTRSFSSAAYWSPFFAAFAAASVYAGEASLVVLLPAGFALACVAFILTVVEVLKDDSEKIDNFIGYPIHFDALLWPAVLAVLVFITHQLFPSIKVIILISLSAFVVSLGVVLARKGVKQGAAKIKQHVNFRLPEMKSELLLFLVAGLFGTGLAAVLQGLSIGMPIDSFDGLSASVLLFIMLLLSLVGVHPVISIAVIGQWIAELNPDQTLLAIMFLMSWAIGVSTSPFSGMNLALQGRFGMSGRQVFKWNLRYALKMYIACCGVLFIVNYLQNH